MHTKHVEYLLPEYIDGTIDEFLRRGVEEHLKECGACRTELADLRETIDVLRGQKAESIPAGYLTTLLPRVRERLEREESRNVFESPLLTRFALPVAAAAIAIFIIVSFPFPAAQTDAGHNPLQAFMHGSTTDDLVDAVLDLVPLQPLSTPGAEGETSSLVGAGLLRGDHLLANADDELVNPELTLDERLPEGLEQLSDADIQTLVRRLGERNMI